MNERYEAQRLGRNYWRVYDWQAGIDVATFMGSDAESRAQERAQAANERIEQAITEIY